MFQQPISSPLLTPGLIPNPVSQKLDIAFEQSNPNAVLYLNDATGTLLTSSLLQDMQSSVDLSALPAG